MCICVYNTKINIHTDNTGWSAIQAVYGSAHYNASQQELAKESTQACQGSRQAN